MAPNQRRMAAGSSKIRSKVGRRVSRSSRVSLTSKTMIGLAGILPFLGRCLGGLPGRWPGQDLVRSQSAVGSVWDDLLAGGEVLLDAVEGHGELVGLEGDVPGDLVDLAVGVQVGPGGVVLLADVPVAAEPLVGAECLTRDGVQVVGAHVLTRDVPAWRKARFVEDQRPLAAGDQLAVAVNGQQPRGP